MKKCSKCNIEKEIIKFHKDKYTKDYLTCWCKDCSKEYQQNNKNKLKEYNKEYYLTNKEKINNQQKEYYLDNKDKIKDYYQTNKDKISNTHKEYRENNRENINLRYNKRRKEDIQFRLSHNLRRRLHSALKGNYKSGSAVSDLGCSINDLKMWLEDQFKDGMTWDNYGNKDDQWSIDHIIPLSKVDLTNREDLLKVCNYVNLQPLWHIDNLKKGNKI